MSKPTDTRAIFSPDGTLDWPRESQGAIPVSKLALGTPPTAQGGTDKFIEAKIPEDLAALFPALTHLHLWGAAKLEKLPTLPPGLRTLDVRNCTNLTALPETLATDFPELEILDLGRSGLRRLPPALPPKLRELYVDHCVALEGKTLPTFPETLECWTPPVAAG